MNLKQIKAREHANKQRILAICPGADEKAGIYVFRRHEDGFKFAYVGQAKHLLTRLAQHLAGHNQHIDLSLKKHGLYDKEDNPTGWVVEIHHCHELDLDQQEADAIKHFANQGYQMRNKTSGGQGVGKVGIADNKPTRGYRDGIARGRELIRREIAKYFEPYLTVVTNWEWHTGDREKIPKSQAKALEKFKEFLQGGSK